MSRDEVAGIFSRAAAGYDRTGPRVFSHFGRRLVERAGVFGGAEVLDVAVGKGAILLPAAQSARRAVGVDLSSGMLSELRREAANCGLVRLWACRMDALRLAFAAASFDFVFCGNSIYYFPRAVEEFHRVLRPGGRAGVSIVARGCFDWMVEAIAAHLPAFPASQEAPGGEADEEPEAAVLDTTPGLAALLRRAGFGGVQVVEEAADFVFADEAEWWALMWTLGIRGSLEQMAPAAVEDVRRQIFGRLQSFKQADGVHVPFRLLFGLGAREA